MSSFITDLPLKNSFLELDYNCIDKSYGSKSLQRNENKTYMSNNHIRTLHTNCKMLSFQANTKKESFLSRTDRFQRLSEDKILNPGPGAYQLSLTLPSVNSISFSSKGYGVGFISKDERFNYRHLERGKYSPGPGEYRYERFKDMQHSIQNSLKGQSLYNSKETMSKKIKQRYPGPCTYDPIKAQEIVDSLHGPVFHKLKSKRFKMIKNDIPGPGTYNEEFGRHRFNDNNKVSFFFRRPMQSKEDPLKKYQIKTVISKKDTAFCLRQNKGDGQLMKAKISPMMNILEDHQELKIGANNNVNSTYNNEGIEYELNTGKKDLLGLAAPRWKKNKYQFLVPGPAFYCLKLSHNKLSFNQSNNNFLYSPGVLFSSTAPYPSKY